MVWFFTKVALSLDEDISKLLLDELVPALLLEAAEELGTTVEELDATEEELGAIVEELDTAEELEDWETEELDTPEDEEISALLLEATEELDTATDELELGDSQTVFLP